MALAVACNFHSRELAPPPHVRAMALYLANRMRPGLRVVKLADHQLKHRRHPAPIAMWSDREALGSALWSVAWNANRAAVGESDTGMLLLDLAAAFDPSDLNSMERYRAMSKEQMEGRWLETVRLPRGSDAPDFVVKPVLAKVEAIPKTPPAAAKPTKPAEFAFEIVRASILVPARGGGFTRLEAEAKTFTHAYLQKRHKEFTGPPKKGATPKPYVAPKLAIDLQPGAFEPQSRSAVLAEIRRARGEFMRRRQGDKFAKGCGVQFRVDGRPPLASGTLSAAAGIILESMAAGTRIDGAAASACSIGFGSTMLPGSVELWQVFSRSKSEGRREVLMAVPESAADAVTDLAALGEYRTLMDIQLISCARLDDAVRTLGAGSSGQHKRAFDLFADIGRAAERVAPRTLLKNPLVRARLQEVIQLCPQHLSAASLLRIARADPSASIASLDGSVKRLRRLDDQVRTWVNSHLGKGEVIEGAGAVSDHNCAAALADLRALRPHLHPGSRGYADQLFELVQDLRESLRSGGSGPTVTARRAGALRSALDTLTLEVAAIGIIGF